MHVPLPGSLRPAESTDLECWRQFFDAGKDLPKMSRRQRFGRWVAKKLLGLRYPGDMSSTGAFSYEMTRAPKGHLDVLFHDEELRVTRGNRGSIVIAERQREA